MGFPTLYKSNSLLREEVHWWIPLLVSFLLALGATFFKESFSYLTNYPTHPCWVSILQNFSLHLSYLTLLSIFKQPIHPIFYLKQKTSKKIKTSNHLRCNLTSIVTFWHLDSLNNKRSPQIIRGRLQDIMSLAAVGDQMTSDGVT